MSWNPVDDPETIVTDHLGPEGTSTQLEFSSMELGSGRRLTHSRLEDQAAYDAWHQALLLQELVASRMCAARPESTLQDVPRPEKNLLVALALAARPDFRRVVELGSSLFELVDGLRAAARVLSDHGSIAVPDVRALDFIGIDISSTMREAAVALHPDARIEGLADATHLKAGFDFLYDRNVSSYAFTQPGPLADLLAKGQAGLLNLFISLGSTFSSNRMGKTLTYFGLEELLETLDQPLFHLFGSRSPGIDLSRGQSVIEGFFLYGPQDFASDWWSVAHRDPDVAQYFESKDIQVRPAEFLLTESRDR